MRITVNLDTHFATITTPARVKTAKQPIAIVFERGGQPVVLEGIALAIGFKQAGEFDGAPIVVFHDDFFADAGTYSAAVNFATAELFALLGIADQSETNDKEEVELSGEVLWVIGNNTYRSQTFSATIEPSIIAGEVPTQLPMNQYPAPSDIVLVANKATQAEAEAGVNNTKWMTPFRVAQAINSSNHSKAVYLAAWGNDATALAGNPSHPFSTIQAAYAAASELSRNGNVPVELHIAPAGDGGDYGNLAFTYAYESVVFVGGILERCRIGNVTITTPYVSGGSMNPTVLLGNGKVSAGDLFVYAPSGGDNPPDATMGSSGLEGNAGDENNPNGGNGEAGYPNNGTDGNPGGDLMDVTISGFEIRGVVRLFAGLGQPGGMSTGGAGGNGGAAYGEGTPGTGGEGGFGMGGYGGNGGCLNSTLLLRSVKFSSDVPNIVFVIGAGNAGGSGYGGDGGWSGDFQTQAANGGASDGGWGNDGPIIKADVICEDVCAANATSPLSSADGNGAPLAITVLPNCVGMFANAYIGGVQRSTLMLPAYTVS